MPSSVRVKYIQRFINRHGKEQIYYRPPGGKLIRLRGPIGSPEFLEDYLKATTGATIAKPPSRNVSRGSMTQIVSQYYASADYKNNLGEVTRKRRKTILTDFLNKYGDTKITDWEVRHIRKLRDENASTPGSANDVIKALRGVFRFALDNDIISYNPMRDVPLLKGSSEGFREWTIFDIEKYEERWPIGTKERLALALLVYTGQRRSDIIVLGRQHEKDGWLYFTQHKNRERKPVHMSLPILSGLRKILDVSPTGDLTYLVTQYGRPFKNESFGNWFRKAVRAAGLDGLSAHGLRKSAAVRLAADGHSDHEIMAMGGWDTLKEVSRYTKGVRRKRLAENVLKRDQEGQN